jgi:hypothetical protein
VPDPLTKSQDDLSEKPAELVSEVIEQRKSSLRYFNSNFYSELAETYRNIHARVKPIMYKDHEGTEREDTSKTNVCVPDHFVMLRRGTARLTRNPPNLRVRGGPDTPDGMVNRDKIGAHLMFQWDRSEAQRAFKPTVSHAYGMGWGIGKVYYDEVSVVRRLRRLARMLAPKDFQNLTGSQDPAVARTVEAFGPRLQDETPFTPEETATMVAQLGKEVALRQKITRYKGPVLANVFPGDLYPEAGFRSLNESAYLTENSLRDEDWLNYWLEQTSIDPRTGESKPVFDAAAVQKALDKAGSRTYLDEQEMTLRRWMREEIEIADPMTSGKPIKAPKKRVMIDERHSIIAGHLCIDFVAEESEYLGRLWYPWETYGRYQYCEMVLIPDWLGGIGQSTLKVTRWLLQLRNARLNQTTDFINNKLLPLLLQRGMGDYTAYDLVRTGFARVLKVENITDFKFEDTPAFPAEAWEDQAQYKQDMQQVDPSTVDFAPGTAAAPGPGKFATTARLADKAADSVTADTLDQINMFVRDVVELELWMNQQAMDKEETIPGKYMSRANPDEYALSIRTVGGAAREVKIAPMDIQNDYEVLPEAGSTLASDDDFKTNGLQAFWALGQGHPDIINLRAVATALARATPGIDPETVILPPPPPQPPQPPAKLNISLAIKWENLPPDVQSAILQREGLPVELAHVEGVGKMIKAASEAADHAANLEQPVHQTPEPQPSNGNQGKPKAKP